MKIRKWLIEKLGGRLLSDEQKQVLFEHAMKTFHENARKAMEKELADILMNGFTSSYTNPVNPKD